MKKQLLFSIVFFFISFFGFSQDSYVKITSVIPEKIEVGTTLKVNYKYSSDKDTNIYCGINLQDDWTWVSFVGGEGKNVTTGTDVEGSFDIFIPKGTIPSADLKDKLNYKIKIEMKLLPSYTWITGDYPPTPLNFTSSK
jgi:hypothetical protein